MRRRNQRAEATCRQQPWRQTLLARKVSRLLGGLTQCTTIEEAALIAAGIKAKHKTEASNPL